MNIVYKKALETQRRITFLSEASKVLMSSLNYEAAFANLARLAVPGIADGCVIYTAEDEEGLRPKAFKDVNPEKEPAVDDRTLITVFESGEPILTDKSIILSIYSIPPIRLPVRCDPDRIQQIVWNLVSNAIKFTPAEGRIEIRSKSMGSHAQIKGMDNGRREFGFSAARV